MPIIINLRYKIIKADAVAEFLFPAVFFVFFSLLYASATVGMLPSL